LRLPTFLTGVLDMKKNVLALSIAAMIGGLGFAGIASADVIRGTGAANCACRYGETLTDGKWSAAGLPNTDAQLRLSPTNTAVCRSPKVVRVTRWWFLTSMRKTAT
jgi:hypothetical protein